MLFVALTCTAWKVYRSTQHARLLRELQAAKLACDNALQEWKLAAATVTGRTDSTKEATLRAHYFEHRASVESALKRLAHYDERMAK